MTTKNHRRAVTVARFKALLKSNPYKLFKLSEVCAAIGVEERTFNNSCHEHVGMSPKRYIALRRMQRVRRALLRASSSTTVTRLAFEHGYRELGRFAAEYRALFGELPSITLQRPRVDGLVSRPPAHRPEFVCGPTSPIATAEPPRNQ
jgi:AraC-like DNA-binding protein